MADLDMQVEITRGLLGMPQLQINDYINYYCAPQFLGAAMQWQRNQVGGPFTDGMVTTYRQRGMVMEQIAIEVLGADQAELASNMAVLVQAMQQDQYQFKVFIAGTEYSYAAESADLTGQWTGPRMIENQMQLVFTMPRQPVPLVGAF